MADLSQFQHPRFARMYERISAESERRGTAAHRDRALAGLVGRVIEIGAGNGLNFSHYPDAVTEVVAVEPDDHLRGLAEEAATRAPVPVRVLAGHATALPVDDHGFDAAVASLVLCSIADTQAALAEIRRVLKPTGQLRFSNMSAPRNRGSACCKMRSHHCGRVSAAVAIRTATPPRRSAPRVSTSKS